MRRRRERIRALRNITKEDEQLTTVLNVGSKIHARHTPAAGEVRMGAHAGRESEPVRVRGVITCQLDEPLRVAPRVPRHHAPSSCQNANWDMSQSHPPEISAPKTVTQQYGSTSCRLEAASSAPGDRSRSERHHLIRRDQGNSVAVLWASHLPV